MWQINYTSKPNQGVKASITRMDKSRAFRPDIDRCINVDSRWMNCDRLVSAPFATNFPWCIGQNQLMYDVGWTGENLHTLGLCLCNAKDTVMQWKCLCRNWIPQQSTNHNSTIFVFVCYITKTGKNVGKK